MLYTIPSEKMRNCLKETVQQTNGIKAFSTIFGYSENNVRRWLLGERSFPFRLCKIISNYRKTDVWDLLENEKIKPMTTTNVFTFSSKISLEECNLLGWIFTEGHLGDRLCISQKDVDTLKTLKIRLAKIFGIFESNISITRDRECWKLRVSNFSSRIISTYDMGYLLEKRAALYKFLNVYLA